MTPGPDHWAAMATRTNRRNYYRILHVQPDAPLEIIRSSYRTIMQRLKQHPDLGGDHWNAALVNEAYAILASSTTRAEYDRQLLSQSRGRPARAANRSTRPRGPYVPLVRSYCWFCQTPHACGMDDLPDASCADCGSPLCPADRRRLDPSGQRAVARIPRRHTITFYSRWPQDEGESGETEEISLNGLSFFTDRQVAPKSILKIDSEVCRAVGRVASCRSQTPGSPGRWLVGVEFISLRFARSRGAFVSTEG